MEQAILELETRGWEALSASDLDEARTHFQQTILDDAMWISPRMDRIQGKQQLLDSLASIQVDMFEIVNDSVIALGANAATLIYTVHAKRVGSGSRTYKALASSTYVRESGSSAAGSGAKQPVWRLAVHQETELEGEIADADTTIV